MSFARCPDLGGEIFPHAAQAIKLVRRRRRLGSRKWTTVTLDEDRSQDRTGHGAHVMAALRNLVITALRLSVTTNIAAGLRHHARDTHRPFATNHETYELQLRSLRNSFAEPAD
ncbi:hypothetical protein [Amycolatopsis sp. H20-H5]|uniref:hypothetical protein n=1 Tax=Amycolatopsis sp. H20-H5 TaxID=3046309 RepID=UPI002DBEBE87|nr:hypothetical protein [Amycolatopsis sp. H20-H5]MEC3975575.1 hypothetical protein [Amycolatopsis sp. H20-H5]